ncbi:MAG: tetratricopeptide repeat protein [Leptolyngbyaceae cyanobacterium bins.59]|nr:tetratricopeptide repeat protein [Leptolyngbyaceae cyanobacterium bins.59]
MSKDGPDRIPKDWLFQQFPEASRPRWELQPHPGGQKRQEGRWQGKANHHFPGLSSVSSNHPEQFSSNRNYRQLLVEWDLLLATQPEHSEIWYNRGDALANLGDCQAALLSFNRALELQPDAVEALVFQAVMLIQLERYGEALASCDRALQITPDHSEAWLFRGVALRYLGRWREAYASYDRASGKKRLSFRQWLFQKIEKISRIWRFHA